MHNGSYCCIEQGKLSAPGVSKHEIGFGHRGIPVVNQFVARDAEMQALRTVHVNVAQKLPRGELTADDMQKLKELLSVTPAAEIAKTRTMKEAIRETVG